MKWRILFFVLAGVLTGGGQAKSEDKVQEVYASAVGQGTVIMGMLGKPIGQEVTIHGRKVTNLFTDLFVVDMIDGEKCTPSATIHVSGIENWPDNTQATLYGHEIGTIRFKGIGDTQLRPGAKVKPVQMVILNFVTIKIVEPKGLKMEQK